MVRKLRKKELSPQGEELYSYVEFDDVMKELEDSGKDVDDIKKEVEDTSKDVDDIKKEVEDTGKDVDEIKKEVVDTGKDVDEIMEHVSMLRKAIEGISSAQKKIGEGISKRITPEKFEWDDVAQQIVGAIILSTPFAVTEEVWRLAEQLDPTRVSLIIGITLVFDVLLIYYTKYQTIKPMHIFGFFPARIFSMIIISYITAASILYIFGVIGNEVTSIDWILRLIVLVGLFANIGAGTADLLK